MSIALATGGKFWPQAGHGIWSDGGKLGVNEYGELFKFLEKEKEILKAIPVDKTVENIKFSAKLLE